MSVHRESTFADGSSADELEAFSDTFFLPIRLLRETGMVSILSLCKCRVLRRLAIRRRSGFVKVPQSGMRQIGLS